MLRMFLLSISFLGCLSTAVPAAIENDLAKIKVEAETCVENARRICVVSAATKILTSSKNLKHLFKTDPDLVEWYIRIFERSSFEVAKQGRPPFRKFLSENATWALDFHSELRKFLGELPLGTRKKEIAFAGFDLIRANACLEMQIDHCAQAATRGVYNAHRRQYWDMVVEKFELEEPFNSEMPLMLMEEFEGRL